MTSMLRKLLTLATYSNNSQKPSFLFLYIYKAFFFSQHDEGRAGQGRNEFSHPGTYHLEVDQEVKQELKSFVAYEPDEEGSLAIFTAGS